MHVATPRGDMTIKISVIIKSLNEQDNIARAIESSLAAIEPFGGEVIVADSASTDRTTEIAASYPVKVVTLANPEERCCGIGPELGYQHSQGEYVYILDGDMELQAPFIAKAVELLDTDPTLAGIGGFVEEVRAMNLEFRARQRKANRLRPRKLAEIECLSGGGLYRRQSLEQVGYFSDRNLGAFEEYDVGTRLRKIGWRLVAIPDLSAKHYSYDMPTSQMLWHRLTSPASLTVQGDLVRAAIASGYLDKVFPEIRAMRISLGVIAAWIAALLLLIVLPHKGLALALVVAGPVAMYLLLAKKHESWIYPLYSLVIWQINAAGLILGLFRRRKSPTGPIAYRSITASDLSKQKTTTIGPSPSMKAASASGGTA